MKYFTLLSFIILFLSCKDQVGEIKQGNNLYYDQAFEYRDKNMDDSSFFYFNKAKDLFLQKKDTLGAGKCLVNMGLLSLNRGDYFGAQEISLAALSYFNLADKEQYVYISSNYNNLGMASQNLQDYKSAIRFSDQAIAFSVDSLNIRVNLNNKANSYRHLKDYHTALSIYNLVLGDVVKNKKEYARALTNISLTKWQQNPKFNPAPDYLKALHLREQQNDLWGQNSSYSHLAEYYVVNHTDSALLYAIKMYQVAKKINSPDDRLEALRKLVKLSPPKETKKYFKVYEQLDDSLKTARNSAKNQFALIRYETEKHKADFLSAQAENVRKRNNIIMQYFALGILVLLLFGAYFWYRKRKIIHQQEKELEVKNTELKYVKKIHDKVANRVYQVMSEVENSPLYDRDDLLDKLEILYNISRDISYEVKVLNAETDYAAQLSEMLQSYSSSTTKVLLVGNDEDLWKDINHISKEELFVIMQELMTNMDKYSKAATVVIKFQRNDSCINISYSDDGVGMQGAHPKNGLTNTGNRMNSIGGTITFDHTQQTGLGIMLSLPIS